jgi:hypothetical protein
VTPIATDLRSRKVSSRGDTDRGAADVARGAATRSAEDVRAARAASGSSRGERGRPSRAGARFAGIASSRASTGLVFMRSFARAARHARCSMRGMGLQSPSPQHTYTATCIHCARVVFRRARRVGDVQLTMIETHVLVCRPLATHDGVAELLAHCRISESPR